MGLLFVCFIRLMIWRCLRLLCLLIVVSLSTLFWFSCFICGNRFVVGHSFCIGFWAGYSVGFSGSFLLWVLWMICIVGDVVCLVAC